MPSPMKILYDCRALRDINDENEVSMCAKA
jgi:hypothetical protein